MIHSANESLYQMTQYLIALEQAEGFSGAALVTRGDDVIFEHAVGFADLGNNLPITPKTIFRIGSLTKLITAVVVFQLQDEGLLCISDQACKYVPGCPATWSEITIHQLLTHTSGIPNFTSLPDYSTFMCMPTTPNATLARVKNLPLECNPGDKFAYSNSGYVLLGLLLEKVSGSLYTELLQNKIFEPLDMRDTGYEVPSPLLARLAQGYELTDDLPIKARYIHMSVPHAAGALYSTVEDLQRFTTCLFRGKLLSSSSLKTLLSPTRERQACGWIIGEHHRHPMVWHNGGINGFSSHLAYFSDERMTVVVLSNRESGTADKAARDLASIALHEPYARPVRRVIAEVSADVLLAYAGDYEIKPGITLAVIAQGGHLYVQATGQERFRATAMSESRFFVRAVNAELNFERDENGVPLLILRQLDKEVRARKLIGVNRPGFSRGSNL